MQVTESRTKKSLRNSAVALGFCLVNLLLQFYSRKIFLEYLGAEVLGLNTTATNLLQFLNLAELGIGAAVSFTLYRPLLLQDTDQVNEIISLQGFLYRRIACFLVIGSIVLMGLFPWIFEDMALPLWYAYASFSVLLVSSLLGYFVNYKQILLTADQKDYKVQYSQQAAKLLKIGCQIAAMLLFDHAYIWWLVLELIFACVGSVAVELVTRRTYPYLKPVLRDGKQLQKKYPEIGRKIKQVFFHKIGSFALTQTSPIIIYAYTSLTVVAKYGNYMLIIVGVTSLMNAIFNSITASVGNLVAEGDKEHSLAVFEELFSLRFIVLTTICYGVYQLTADFVSLWIGPEYVMDNTILLILLLSLYISLSRSTVDAFIAAYGLYGDIWAPIVEAVINVSLSVLLGYFWGLHGVLLGVLISQVLVIFCWKPYWLFRNGFKTPLRVYIKMYGKHLFMFAFVWWVASRIYVMCKLPLLGVSDFVVNSVLSIGVFFCGMSLIILAQNPRVWTRVKTILSRR